MINSFIKGTTDVYGVIGSPIEHTFSPNIHNTVASALKRDFAYLPFLVNAEELEEAIAGAYALHIKGLNVTVPHKKAVMPLLCGIDKKAEVIGAVNTLKYTDKGYFGYNTDIIGAEYAIKGRGFDISGKKVLLLGAGGAANACAVMAAECGCSQLYIANRTKARAEALAASIRSNYNCEVSALTLDEIYNIDSVQLVMNATTIGFGDKIDETPIRKTSFFADKGVRLVFDAIYSPWLTQLLKDAQEAGVAAVNGFDMLVYQALAAEEIWFDKHYDAAFKEKIRAELSTYYRGK